MPVSCQKIFSTVAWYVFDYTTPKIVTIRSLKLGLINRLVQLAIIAYIIGFVLVYKKGYQDTDTAKSTVTTKVKGIASTLNRSDLDITYRRIWDTPDYVIPAQESNAFFVMTNAVITPRQQHGKCAENPKVSKDAICNPKHNNCREGKFLPNGNGVQTGKCIKSKSYKNYTCEILAWCPVENDELPSEKPLLIQAETFTVLIKNFIEFPKFGNGYKKRNIIDKVNNSSYLKQCRYNQQRDPYCPIFELGYITRKAKANFTSLAKEGGIISIVIKWDCDLDYGLEYCLPNYHFSRLDDEKAHIAPGWNFRFSKEYRDNNDTLSRDLYKAYGILFVFSVQGKAGKFSPIPLFVNVGSGLALLGLATVMCDLVLLNVLKKRKYYQGKKYLSLVDEDFVKLANQTDEEISVSTQSEQESFDRTQKTSTRD